MNKDVNVYNNEQRFLFNNWSDEDFSVIWDGRATIVKASEIKDFPMYLAYHATKHFVDREMIKAGQAAFMGVDDYRKDYEKKTIEEITGDTESPAMRKIKEQLRKEIESQPKPTVETTNTIETPKEEEFADLKEEVVKEATEEAPVVAAEETPKKKTTKKATK